MANTQVFVVAKDSGIEKLADLKGKNVVVQAASAALDALNNDDNKELKDSFASLTENPDYNTAFMNIDSGAADAVAVDIGVANYQLSQRGKDKYVILDEPIQNEQYGIGFKKGNDELKDLVWDEVKKLDESGEVDKLADKYELDKSMLCISEDKDKTEDSDSAEAETEEKKTGCYRHTEMQRDLIIEKLKEKGFRITRQRKILLDIILEGECSCCKEIYYRAFALDPGIGVATVYRMINTLESIGAISRKNMYQRGHAAQRSLCSRIDDDTICHLSGQKLNEVILAGLRACGEDQ